MFYYHSEEQIYNNQKKPINFSSQHKTVASHTFQPRLELFPILLLATKLLSIPVITACEFVILVLALQLFVWSVNSTSVVDSGLMVCLMSMQVAFNSNTLIRIEGDSSKIFENLHLAIFQLVLVVQYPPIHPSTAT